MSSYRVVLFEKKKRNINLVYSAIKTKREKQSFVLRVHLDDPLRVV